MTIKDFYIDYQSMNDSSPTEEEWQEYIGNFVDDHLLHKGGDEEKEGK